MLANSTCKICSGLCGMAVEIEEGRVVSARGDRANPYSRGYACTKGLRLPDMMNSGQRVLHPLKRQSDGSFAPIALETALDEIAEHFRVQLRDFGPDSIALFKGTQSYTHSVTHQILNDWMTALGSSNFFSTLTIDQSSHAVTMGRMGFWDAGKPRLHESDVAMLIGTNPLVSLGAYGLLASDPLKRLRDAKKNGLKLIVIDPRETETAKQADCFLQPRPGEDVTVIAGLLHLILAEGWQDQAFCDAFADGLAHLPAALAMFTPDYVARRAGVGAETLHTAAAMFARDAKRGIALVGTGTTMARRSNLADHLAETLNVVCGRLLREGDRVSHPGVAAAPRTFRAEVVPASRSWETGTRSASGHGTIAGEKMSGVLADEILGGVAGIRSLIVSAGNPAVCLPDQTNAVKALRALDLLVCVEPFMTATAQLSHYVIPTRIGFEREDIALAPPAEPFYDGIPYNRYLPALVSPPAGSQVVDDWYVYWSLSKRLGLDLHLAGQRLTLDAAVPETRQLLDILLRDSRIPLDEIRRHPIGHIFDEDPVFVEPALSGSTHRFQLAPQDVLDELRVVAEERFETPDVDQRLSLIVRRTRAAMNSLGTTFTGARGESRVNPLYMHPRDLAARRLIDGGMASVESASDRIVTQVRADVSLREGVVAMTHCRGLLPGAPHKEVGVCSSRLVATDRHVEAINAMPMMTGIRVAVRPVEPVTASQGAFAGVPA